MTTKEITVAVASQSDIKVAAVRQAFEEAVGPDVAVNIESFNVATGVNEQPVGEAETLRGAQYRIAYIMAACANADVFISIENGLFEEYDEYVDRAVVSMATQHNRQPTFFYSRGVIFPKKYVEATRDREGGFKEWTVGKTMAEAGIVKDHADPHVDLDPAGRSRVEFLNNTVRKAVSSLNL